LESHVLYPLRHVQPSRNGRIQLAPAPILTPKDIHQCRSHKTIAQGSYQNPTLRVRDKESHRQMLHAGTESRDSPCSLSPTCFQCSCNQNPLLNGEKSCCERGMAIKFDGLRGSRCRNSCVCMHRSCTCVCVEGDFTWGALFSPDLPKSVTSREFTTQAAPMKCNSTEPLHATGPIVRGEA